MTIIIALDKLNSTRSNVVKSVIKLHTRINICRHEPHKVHVKLRLTSLWITQLRRVFHRASVRDRENLIYHEYTRLSVKRQVLKISHCGEMLFCFVESYIHWRQPR